MNRRTFLSGSLMAAALLPAGLAAREKSPRLMSVNGWLDEPGIILPHEHILVDFIGAARIDPSRYDPEEAFRTALPRLLELKQAGASTLVECTPAYLGRDPLLLQRLSLASGIHILTNTGYYGARQHLFFPAHVSTESAAQLAARWIAEWEEGIGASGVKPGFIKCGVDGAPLSGLQKKVLKAAAFTHLATGLTIGVHTGNGAAAEEEFRLLRAEGVQPEAFIWIHAQGEKRHDFHFRLAEEGAWIEFDGLSKQSADQHLELLSAMQSRRLLGRTLVSHDAGWYHVGEPGGGNYRSYTYLLEHFVPHLLSEGFSRKEVDMLIRSGPREAFGIRLPR